MRALRRAVACIAIAATAALLLPAPGPVQGAAQTFVFVQGTEYDNLDPHAIFDQSRVASRLNLYDGLYRCRTTLRS